MIARYPNGLNGLACDCGSLGGLRALTDIPAIGLDYTNPADWAQMALRFTNDAFSGQLSPSSITATMDLVGIDPAEQPAVRNLVNSALAFATQQGWTEAETQAEIRRLLSVTPPAKAPVAATDNTMLYVALAVAAVLLLRK